MAFERANIPIANYYASEIDKYAIKVSKKNHPAVKHLGDVKNIKETFPIDFLIGGSPCQDMSIAKKERKGLQGDRSSLFWEYVRILRDFKPKYFILENVASMSKADKDTISQALGVEPIMINASLVSAQNRKRYFWTNIPGVVLPDDRGIILRDILEPSVDPKYICNKEYTLRENSRVIGLINNKDSQANRIYSVDHKGVTLSSSGGGLGAKTGLYRIGCEIGRRVNSDGKREDNNKDLEVKRFIEVRTHEKSGCLTSVQKDNLVIGDNIVRRLTPVECERLQGLPDNYTFGISDTQRYKCLGNAFNVDVIKHILSFIAN